MEGEEVADLVRKNPRLLFQPMIVLVVVLSQTVTFLLRELLDPYLPFVILGHAALLFFITVSTPCFIIAAKRSVDLVPASWMWMFWVVYGLIFQNMTGPWSGVIMYVESALAVLLLLVVSIMVKASIQKNLSLIFGANVILVAMLFFPHDDMLSTRLSALFFVFKTVSFFLLYLMSDLILSFFRYNHSKKVDKEEVAYWQLIQIEFLQSFWALLVAKPFLIVVILQLSYGVLYIRATYFSKRSTKTKHAATLVEAEEGRSDLLKKLDKERKKREAEQKELERLREIERERDAEKKREREREKERERKLAEKAPPRRSLSRASLDSSPVSKHKEPAPAKKEKEKQRDPREERERKEERSQDSEKEKKSKKERKDKKEKRERSSRDNNTIDDIDPAAIARIFQRTPAPTNGATHI